MKRALVGVGISLIAVGVIFYATTALHGPVILGTRPMTVSEALGDRVAANESIRREAVNGEQKIAATLIAIGGTLAIIAAAVKPHTRS
ncbi:MAG: hypothetical protein KDA16_11925 [Phycisphaerales bacterium]|nr:hypothetical protein [Phycisphaerales bacterium]